MFSFPGTEPREIAPGALHLPGWLDLAQQRRLAVACHAWARGPVPARAARLPRGGVMSVRTVCLGWHWQPYRYTRTADDAGGGQVAPLPGLAGRPGPAALADAYRDPAPRSYRPDTALINFYDDAARWACTRTRTNAPTSRSSPSASATLRFRFGNTGTRNRPWTDVELARVTCSSSAAPPASPTTGSPRPIRAPRPTACGVDAGRINITLRETGLS